MSRVQAQNPGHHDSHDSWVWSALENAPLGAALISLEGRIEKANASLSRIVGLPASAIQRARLADLIDLGVREPQTWLNSLHQVPATMQQCWLHRHGHTTWGTIVAWLAQDISGKPMHVVLLVINVTRSQQAEQSQLWQMAATLAHEIKNSVAGIGGTLHLIAKPMPEGSEERKSVYSGCSPSTR